MCWGCTPITKTVWSLTSGIVILTIAIIIGVLWPNLDSKIDGMIEDELRLLQFTMNYKNWYKSPFPLYMEFYLFNWTNSEKIKDWKTEKPHFDEMGPYVFEEIHQRVNITYNEDETLVEFNQTKTWWFRPDLSKGKLTDKVTTLNMVAASMAYGARYLDEYKFMINAIIDQKADNQLFTTATVGEWLFDGYKDGILDWLQEEGGGFPPELPIPAIPYKKFGWFVDRNESYEYDGRFQMHTGKDNIKNVGIIKSWNGKETIPFYNDQCALLNGTTGELWPPFDINKKDDATMFISDVCRTLTLKHSGTYKKHGITGWKWVGDDKIMDSGKKYPETECWCTAEKDDCSVLKPGVFNVSDCRFGAPAFVSYPHFYLADESYLKPVSGLSPDKNKHEMYIALEPSMGIPMEIRARMQINMYLRSDPELDIYKDVPNMYVPVIWFTQAADLPDDLGSMINMLFALKGSGMIICYILSAIGSLCVIAGVIFLVLYLKGQNNKN